MNMGASLQPSITPLPAGRPPVRRKRRSALKLTLWLLLLTLCIIAGLLIANELRTSRFQAQELSSYAQTLSYQIKNGPSPSIIYPKEGPFDKRQGYTHLPLMLERLGRASTAYTLPLTRHTTPWWRATLLKANES